MKILCSTNIPYANEAFGRLGEVTVLPPTRKPLMAGSVISTQFAAWANGARQAETARQRPSTACLVVFIISPIDKFQKTQC